MRSSVSPSTRKGKPKTVGEYALHLQCPWQLKVLDGDLIVSSDSSFEERREGVYPPSERSAPRIHSVNCADDLSVSISLSDDVVLGFQHDQDRDSEMWRLFMPYAEDEKHFVVMGYGLEKD